jgi:hypothetical protein
VHEIRWYLIAENGFKTIQVHMPNRGDSEFQANILYSPSLIEPEDQLTFVLFGEDVFVVDHVLARVNCFAGVENTDAYILTKLQYYDDWIMKEIDNRLSLFSRSFA